MHEENSSRKSEHIQNNMKKITIEFIKTAEWIKSTHSMKDITDSLPLWSYSILLRSQTAIRSLDQNSWYWSIIDFLMKNTDFWMTKDDWHEFFAWWFLSEERMFPKPHKIIKSTSDLDTVEFTEYIEKILSFCDLPEKDGWLWIPRKFLLPKLKWLECPF